LTERAKKQRGKLFLFFSTVTFQWTASRNSLFGIVGYCYTMFSRASRRFRYGAGQQKRANSTNNTEEAPKRQASTMKKLGTGVAGIAILAGAIWIGDIWVNDDWEMITDRFRRKLSPEERKDRFVWSYGFR
jgi:hypothetical protein